MDLTSIWRKRCALLVVVFLLFTSAFNAAAADDQTSGEPLAVNPAGYTMIENVGQFAPEARFTLSVGKQRIWLTDDAIWLVTPDPVAVTERGAGRTIRAPRNIAAPRSGAAIRFTFPGANPAARPQPFGRSEARVSYFIGNDPARWRSDAPVWSGVRYPDLYPGVDLIVGGDATGLVPWRFEARAGADVGQVALKVEGADAARSAGQLQLKLKGREVALPAPSWRLAERGAVNSDVAAGAEANTFSLAPSLADTSASQLTMAAPDAGDLVYSRLSGGSLLDAGYAIAVDYAGNAYATGETASSNFPTVPGSYDTTYGGATDAFVAKYNATASSLVYAAYLGGSGLDLGLGVAVSDNLAYVVGETSSANFPGTTGARGQSDIFVVSLNATGAVIRYATLIGGTYYDMAGGIATWGPDAYVVGSTDSTDLTGIGCPGGIGRNMVVARLGATGSLVYTRCFGGGDLDAGYGIDVVNEVAYVTGESWSTDLVPATPLSGENDVLVAAFTGDGNLQDVTLIGGAQGDQGNGIAADVDPDGNGYLYVVGTTASDFPLAVGSRPNSGETDAVVMRVGLESFTPDFAAYLGGSGDDDGRGIAVDTVGGLYVTGATYSTDFSTTSGAYDTSHNGRSDVFVARMHLSAAATNRVTYATYLGGRGEDAGYGAATDTAGHAFVAGSTGGQGFPTTVGPAPTGEDDGFAAKVKVSQPPAAPVVSIAVNGVNAKLTWPTVSGAGKYQVFRGSVPYFKPGEWGGALLLPEPTTGQYTDADALAQAGGYFYVVKSVSAAPEQASANSNRVGKFTFELAKGN